MADNSYNIEIKAASKNGYFTPDESRAYYGRYSRDNYIVHWWGAPGAVGSHDSIVNYILGTASRGQMSVNYVLSNGKISLLVGPDYVSWGAQGGNPTGINVEHEPTLNDEGYKKAGWLKEQLEQRYGKRLGIKRHSDYYATQCPGTVSLDRIEQECDKWRRKVYDQPPVVVPPDPKPPIPAEPKLTPITPHVTKYTLAAAKLVDVKTLAVIKTYPIDTPIEVAGTITHNNLTFWVSAYAASHNTGQAFLQGDLKDAPEPKPQPEPEPLPEWVQNLRDIDNTEYWLAQDQNLIDITTGQPVQPAKELKKDDSFIASAVTQVTHGGKVVEYRITEYSFKKGIFNGVPTSSLTLTEPGVPDIPPVPEPPLPPTAEQLSWIAKALKALLDFLGIKVGEGKS
jgi:hypothetical protein